MAQTRSLKPFSSTAHFPYLHKKLHHLPFPFIFHPSFPLSYVSIQKEGHIRTHKQQNKGNTKSHSLIPINSLLKYNLKMVGRPVFLVVLLVTVALAMVTESSLSSHLDGALARHSMTDGGLIDLAGSRIGDTLSADEEMMMPSETTRRTLNQYGYISYAALMKNNIPCNRRGRSYYQCTRMKRARRYRRGCRRITRCSRRNW